VNRYDFILASSSPRRRDLLRGLGFSFLVVPSGIEEIDGLPRQPHEHTLVWARTKAVQVSRDHHAEWILAADTIVVIDGEILGKPADASEATAMLSRLSGRAHSVVTGFCLLHPAKKIQECCWVETRVHMRRLDPDEIEGYVRTGEPMDKAGAYGIQGIGGCLVRRINGSYSNVVGLPLCEVVELFRRHQVADPFKAA